jgi:transposase-like protein
MMLCFVKKNIMRHTQDQMQQAINEWQQSGLSKKAYCRQHNITYQTFHYWFKRLSASTGSGFTEVKVSDTIRSNGHEIIFPSGARIVFQGEPSVNWLRELVR